jgi:hypothetical protein
MPPGAADGQSRHGIEGATDVYGWTSATDPGVAERHWSSEARIALAYRASLGASQITSTALQIARIFDASPGAGSVIQVASMMSWPTADLNLVRRNEIRPAMSARSRCPATSKRARRQRNDGDLGAHYGTNITRHRFRHGPPLL